MSKSRLWVEQDRDWLMKLMGSFGYEAKTPVCFGYANRALCAGLQYQMPLFDNYVQLGFNYYWQDYSLQKTALVELQTFLETIYIAQFPAMCPELFGGDNLLFQSAEMTLPMTASKALDDQGGVKRVHHVTGAYDLADIEHYLLNLKSAYCANPAEQKPFGVIIRDVEHAIFVQYDPNTKEWVYANSEKPLSKRYKNTNIFAKVLKESFNPANHVILSTQIFATEINLTETNAWVSRWQASEAYQKIHAKTTERALRVDGNGVRWVSLAIQQNDDKTAEQLIQLNAGLDVPDHPNGKSPMFYAVNLAQSEAIMQLLQQSVDPTVPCLHVDVSAIQLADYLIEKYNKITSTNSKNLCLKYASIQHSLSLSCQARSIIPTQ